MLNQPMIEKLLAMRLHGMVEALKAQEQDRAVNELSFLKRFALLVDQQWSWRENQALARRLKAAKLRGPACVEDIDYRATRGLDKTMVRALAKDSAWARNHENIFVIGPCGVGKSFLAGRSRRKLVATATPPCIFAPRHCLGSWAWHGPMAACATSWHDLLASMFWSSMTWP